jgi:hypothetical protein
LRVWARRMARPKDALSSLIVDNFEWGCCRRLHCSLMQCGYFCWMSQAKKQSNHVLVIRIFALSSFICNW